MKSKTADIIWGVCVVGIVVGMVFGIVFWIATMECTVTIQMENINISVMVNFTDILKEYDYYVTDGRCVLKDPKLQISSCTFTAKRPQIHKCKNKQLQTRLTKEYSVYITISGSIGPDEE